MEHEPCKLVLEHHQALGELCADIKHIKAKVDNGLSAKLESVDRSLAEFKINSAAERRVDKAENWFTNILQGSVIKIVGLVVVFIIISSITSSGFTIFLKNYYSLETPGQQKAILEQSKELNKHAYHAHILSDGRILLHAGDPSIPAWCLNSTTKIWERVPQMRTEDFHK